MSNAGSAYEKPVPQVTDMNRLYYEGTAKGELRIRHCPKCDNRFRFAHNWCPACWSQELGWERASGKATVTTFTVVHQPPFPAFADVAPYVLALVQLDEGVRMMTNIVGCPPEEVRIGMAVEVDYEQRGDIRLPVFRPAG